MKNLEGRASSFSQVQVEHGLHQAAALAAMTLLITAHRGLMNTGFTLRRKGLSTDTLISLTIGALTSIWTVLVVISGLYLGEEPCQSGFETCAARLSYAPWIMQIFFLFWVVAYLDEIVSLRRNDHARRSTPPIHHSPSQMTEPKENQSPVTAHAVEVQPDLESPNLGQRRKRRLALQLHQFPTLGIWKMDSSQGPLNWAGSIRRGYLWTLYTIICSVVALLSYAAVKQSLYTVSLLNIVGVVLFIVGAAGANKYVTAPHTYASDTLRVMLHTRHKEGTCYVIPCRDRGFDALWGPKIEYENRALDEAMENSQAEAGGKEKWHSGLISRDKVLAAFNSNTNLSIEDVTYIAEWLHHPERHPKMQRLACMRVKDYNLLGYGVIDALWHAEYLVFMRQGSLPDDLKKLAGKIRSPRGTGLDLDRSQQQIGAKPGMQGYRETVQYIYELFDEPVDQSALYPTSEPPKQSVVLDPCPDTIEEYFAQLWDYCFERQESTFAAMSAFLSYRQADIGNDVPNGWGPFPLRAWDREGDIVSWHVIWRQAWYSAVIAQLTSMSPIILSAFVAGILQ
jgi:hypothetical protein